MNSVLAVLLLTLGAALALDQSLDSIWNQFKVKHGKIYDTNEEEAMRREIFEGKLDQIKVHNLEADLGLHTHTVGINAFGDMTTQEVAARYNGFNHTAAKIARALRPEPVLLSTENLQAEVDWRTKGAVTPVKNQGQCGSCWAFSTTGSVEGAMFLKNNKLQSFSEQQLVDCSTQNNATRGAGLMDTAFKYIEKHPLETEADYPYTAKAESCKYEPSKGVGKVNGFTDVAASASQLKAAISQGPVSVAIEADQSAFQSYTSGVITSGCGTSLDHGVLAVGYGTESGQEFFLVKNSWGPTWGDEGYVRIGQNNECGILNAASYPIV